MAKRTPNGAPPHVVVRSIAFSPSTLDALEAMAKGVASRTGRKASVSAVVRALLRHVQKGPDLSGTLATLVEHEQSTEIVWGKPPRSR